MRVLIGAGRLDWPSRERVSDRYGTITMRETSGREWLFTGAPVGVHGTLMAEVTEQAATGHIGDLFRALGPEPAEVGTVVRLGNGTLFTEVMHGSGMNRGETWTALGLRPDDGRESDWLDPEQLYRVHGQIVRLWFEPDPKDALRRYRQRHVILATGSPTICKHDAIKVYPIRRGWRHDLSETLAAASR